MMYKKGKAYSLKGVIESFLQFAQSSNLTTQSWELVDDRLSSFYGATLKVPMKKWSSPSSKDTYYIVGNDMLDKYTGSTIQIYSDKLKSKYLLSTFIEDYTATDLSSVSTKISSYIMDNKTHVVFNGCEGSAIGGELPQTIIDNIKSIVALIKSYDARPALFITPNPNVFSGGSLLDNYRVFIRSSFITGKSVVLCLGDSLTADIGYSWTTTAQADLQNCTFVNKGVSGDTTTSALARWTSDVINQVPDMCFLLIGMEDMWSIGSSSRLDIAKANITTMVNNCISSGIVPVIGIYSVTLDQIQHHLPSYTSEQHREVYSNFVQYRAYCEDLARLNSTFVVDVYKPLKKKDGNIDYTYMLPDHINFSASGAEKVGKYIAEIIENKVNDINSKLNNDFDIINLYEVFCRQLDVPDITYSDMIGLMYSDNIHYNDIAQTYINSVVFDRNILYASDVPYFYISFEHMNITETSYASWIRTKIIFPEYVGKKSEYGKEYSDWPLGEYYQSEKYNHSSSDGTTSTKYGTSNRENAFRNTGEFVAIGLHTLFDENLWMCEQGGITCEKEARAQINDINLIPARVTESISSPPYVRENGTRDLPVFPGTGCPWFTISDDNKVDFDVANRGIEYWFTKNDYDATITIRVYDKYYQSMSFGRLDNANDETHMFPLYIGGGNQAISEDTYVFTPAVKPGQPRRTENLGSRNSYDLNIKNTALSNSNILTPVKFNKANMSNFRVFSPEGIWRDIFAYKQDASVKAYPTCSDSPDNFGVVVGEPVPLGYSSHGMYPSSFESFNRIDTHIINGIDKNIYSSRLEKIIVFLNYDLDNNENGYQGVVSNCYGSWFKELPSGEINLNGKKYLSVPNGWDNRMWMYPSYLGTYSDPSYWRNSDVADRMDEIMSRVMYHKLLIPLEEGD